MLTTEHKDADAGKNNLLCMTLNAQMMKTVVLEIMKVKIII